MREFTYTPIYESERWIVALGEDAVRLPRNDFQMKML